MDHESLHLLLFPYLSLGPDRQLFGGIRGDEEQNHADNHQYIHHESGNLRHIDVLVSRSFHAHLLLPQLVDLRQGAMSYCAYDFMYIRLRLHTDLHCYCRRQILRHRLPFQATDESIHVRPHDLCRLGHLSVYLSPAGNLS